MLPILLHLLLFLTIDFVIDSPKVGIVKEVSGHDADPVPVALVKRIG